MNARGGGLGGATSADERRRAPTSADAPMRRLAEDKYAERAATFRKNRRERSSRSSPRASSFLDETVFFDFTDQSRFDSNGFAILGVSERFADGVVIKRPLRP
jgi:hypothetical protein